MSKNIKNRSYSISKKPNEMWRANCYDSYNKFSENYFETEEQANEWIYWRWENEVKKPEDLLSKAITNCIEIDKKSGILKENSDGLD